jgi:hypothetical protein
MQVNDSRKSGRPPIWRPLADERIDAFRSVRVEQVAGHDFARQRVRVGQSASICS